MVNHFQRCKLEQVYLDALAVLPEPQMPSPEQQLIVLQALQEVDAMLACLPAVVRQAFLLSQLEGLTYAEIASRIGVNSRTVKRYMAQAFEQCIQFVP